MRPTRDKSATRRPREHAMDGKMSGLSVTSAPSAATTARPAGRSGGADSSQAAAGDRLRERKSEGRIQPARRPSRGIAVSGKVDWPASAQSVENDGPTPVIDSRRLSASGLRIKIGFMVVGERLGRTARAGRWGWRRLRRVAAGGRASTRAPFDRVGPRLDTERPLESRSTSCRPRSARRGTARFGSRRQLDDRLWRFFQRLDAVVFEQAHGR